MRAFWINTGAEVQSYPGLRQLGITHIFWDAHRHTRAHLEQARREGFKVGVYTNPQWFGFESAALSVSERAKAYRTRVSQRLNQLGVNEEQCDVQFNIEKLAALEAGLADGGNQFVIDLFYWWRRSRADRKTSWTMEGHQGGHFWPALRHPNLAGTDFVPQAYDGNMRRWDTYGVVKDLVDWGVPFKRILPFTDAPEARIPYSEGFFYLEHRLYQ